MAIRVPIAESHVEPQQGSAPAVPGLTAPHPIAFGTGIAEQTQRTGQEMSQIGETLANHLIQRTRMAQEAQVIKADTDYRNEYQKSMFDPTPDHETGVPKGVFNRVGLQAVGATEELDAIHKQLRQKYVDQMPSPFMKQQIGEKIDENYNRYRELVARHEGEQSKVGLNAIVQGNLDTQVAHAANFSQDPDGLVNEIAIGHANIFKNAMDNGLGRKGFIAPSEKWTHDITEQAVKPLISADPSVALNYLDKVNSSDDKPLSPAVYNKIKDEIIEKSKLFDGAQKYRLKQVDVSQFNAWNSNEAGLAGKMANGELKQDDLENIKGHVSDAFYKSATTALGNIGKEPEGTPQQQSNAAIALQKQWITLATASPDEKSKMAIKFRSDVLTSSIKLRPDDFNHLLAESDPSFIAKVTPAKLSLMQAGIKYIEDHFKSFVPGGNAATSMRNFIFGSADSSVKPEDVPRVAQAAVRGDTLNEHPSLVGQPDLSNNVINQKDGVKQVTRDKSQLKPDMKISTSGGFKAGDEQKKGDVTYVRDEQGKWHPKS